MRAPSVVLAEEFGNRRHSVAYVCATPEKVAQIRQELEQLRSTEGSKGNLHLLMEFIVERRELKEQHWRDWHQDGKCTHDRQRQIDQEHQFYERFFQALRAGKPYDEAQLYRFNNDIARAIRRLGSLSDDERGIFWELTQQLFERRQNDEPKKQKITQAQRVHEELIRRHFTHQQANSIQSAAGNDLAIAVVDWLEEASILVDPQLLICLLAGLSSLRFERRVVSQQFTAHVLSKVGIRMPAGLSAGVLPNFVDGALAAMYARLTKPQGPQPQASREKKEGGA